MTKVSFSHYPKPFRAAIKILRDYRTNPDRVNSALSKLRRKSVNIDLYGSCRSVEKEEILKSGAVWFHTIVGPCFFIGAAVKNKEGIIDRAAAGHFRARFEPSDLERLLSRILPIAPDEKVNAFITGSSQRNTIAEALKSINNITNNFNRIDLPMQSNTDIWHYPVLRDINKNNMIISDLGNDREEEIEYRFVYFGVTPEDCMLFSVHRKDEITQRIRIITPDVGLIDL